MRVIATLIIIFGFLTLPVHSASTPTEVETQARKLFDQSNQDGIKEAIAYFKERGNPDAVGALLLAMRFTSYNRLIGEALTEITGEELGTGWNRWMLWQEQNPQAAPFEGFAEIHAEVHNRLDGNFALFLGGNKKYDIRVEEITWGGVVKDGIPALTNPVLLTPEQADYIEPGNLVFGVNINGDARAYPLRILDWHEMFNDVVGGVPVSLAYCTLCGSGILYETSLDGFPYPLVFGSSGFLYRSNKLMYDTYTHSLWNQFTGEPVVGPLVGSGIKLKVRPVVITTWEKWLKENPKSKILSVETGFRRDYGTGVAYREYWDSPELMFPASVDESENKAKEYVFSLRDGNLKKAWPLRYFEGGKVINDTAGDKRIVLIGDAATRTVRAYASGTLTFEGAEDAGLRSSDGRKWEVAEDAIRSENGEEFERLAGHVGFWFAWHNYYGSEGEVAKFE